MLGMFSLSCLLLIDIVNLFSRPPASPPVPLRGHAGERGAELWQGFLRCFPPFHWRHLGEGRSDGLRAYTVAAKKDGRDEPGHDAWWRM